MFYQAYNDWSGMVEEMPAEGRIAWIDPVHLFELMEIGTFKGLSIFSSSQSSLSYSHPPGKVDYLIPIHFWVILLPPI